MGQGNARSVRLPGPFRFRFEKLYRIGWHYSRYCMLIDELGMTIPAQQHAEIIEPGYDALELDPIDQENRQGCL